MEPSGASSSSLPPVPAGMSRREYRKYVAELQAQQPGVADGAGMGASGPEVGSGRSDSAAAGYSETPKPYSEQPSDYSPAPSRREWRAQQAKTTVRRETPHHDPLSRGGQNFQGPYNGEPAVAEPTSLDPSTFDARLSRGRHRPSPADQVAASTSNGPTSFAARPQGPDRNAGGSRPVRSADSGGPATPVTVGPYSGQLRRASSGSVSAGMSPARTNAGHGGPRAENVAAFHRPQRPTSPYGPAQPDYAPTSGEAEADRGGQFEFADGAAERPRSAPAAASPRQQHMGRPLRASTMGQPQVANPFQRPMVVAPVPTSQLDQVAPGDQVAPAEVVADSFQPVVWTHLEGDTSVRSRRDLRDERSKQATKITRKFLDRSQYLPKLPKASMVGALGVAAVLTPFMMQNAANTAGENANAQTMIVTNPQDVSADVPNPALIPAASGEQVQMASPIINEAAAPAMDPESLVASRLAAEEASQEFNRNPLPDCDPSQVTAGNENGRLDTDQLCALWQNGHRLRADAAVAFARLNEEYTARFGDTITVTDSYRSYSQQVTLRRKKPGLAAAPGTSEHGWGLAVDMADGVPNVGERYLWLREVAPKYGWDNPEWARKGGSGAYEPWHWEYTPTDEVG